MSDRRPPRVFLSYAHADASDAGRLADWLGGRNLRCWIDRLNLRSGEGFDPQIDDAIRSAEVIVVLVTRHTGASRYVAHEVSLALGAGKTVILFRREPVDLAGLGPPFDIHLSRMHALDRREDGEERHFERLQTDIFHHLRQSVRRRRTVLLRNSSVGALALGVAAIVGWQLSGDAAVRKWDRAVAPAPDAADSPARPSFAWEVFGKPQGATNWSSLPPGSSLRSGDYYAVGVRPVTAGHLYLFQQDATGRTQWLFPRNDSLEFSEGKNPVEAGLELQVPSSRLHGMILDTNLGSESLVAVLSATPLPELERMLRAGELPPLDRGQFLQWARKGAAGVSRVELAVAPRPGIDVSRLPWSTPRQASVGGRSVLVETWTFEHVAPR